MILKRRIGSQEDIINSCTEESIRIRGPYILGERRQKTRSILTDTSNRKLDLTPNEINVRLIYRVKKYLSQEKSQYYRCSELIEFLENMIETNTREKT